MINDNEFEYEPNDVDSDSFISELPMSLMKENIASQFEDPLEYRKKDYIQSFLSMYANAEDNLNVYEEGEKEELQEIKDDFYSFMHKIFMDYLGIGFVDFFDMPSDEQDDMIHYIYRFFIVNMKKNFTCFLLNYIDEHRGEFISDDYDKRRDVTTLSLKKDIDNPEDVYILANLGDVISDILRKDISCENFINNCDMDESCLETRFVKEKFNNDKFTGNFVEKYIDMLDDDFLLELELKIRNRILKKYKKK